MVRFSSTPKMRAAFRRIRKLTLDSRASGPCAVSDVTVRGVTYPYFCNAVGTLGEWYAQARTKHGDLEFIFYTGKPGGLEKERSLTYAETLDESDAVRRALYLKFGVRHGDRVGILMSNIPEFATCFMGVTEMGAVAVALNAFWGGEEIEYVGYVYFYVLMGV